MMIKFSHCNTFSYSLSDRQTPVAHHRRKSELSNLLPPINPPRSPTPAIDGNRFSTPFNPASPPTAQGCIKLGLSNDGRDGDAFFIQIN